jgi:hypothetical protein
MFTGRPNRAVFLSSPHGRFRDNYNISFSVDSYTPVEEYKLYFRKLPVSIYNILYVALLMFCAWFFFYILSALHAHRRMSRKNGIFQFM